MNKNTQTRKHNDKNDNIVIGVKLEFIESRRLFFGKLEGGSDQHW